MHTKSWKEKRDELYKLVLKESEMNGGDDIDEFEDYFLDLLTAYKDRLEVSIECFENLCKKYKQQSIIEEKVLNPNKCYDCGYVIPFCRFDLNGFCTNVK